MRRVSSKEREGFVRVVVEEVAKVRGFVDCIPLEHQITLLARRILRWGRTYGRLAEKARIERWQGGLEKRQARAERLIGETCGVLNALGGNQRYLGTDASPPHFTPVFSGDPKGHTVKIKVPSGRTDDLGQTGVCVPTS